MPFSGIAANGYRIRGELGDLAPGSVAIGIWVGVAMHDLPLAVRAPTDRRDSQLIRLGICAADQTEECSMPTM